MGELIASGMVLPAPSFARDPTPEPGYLHPLAVALAVGIMPPAGLVLLWASPHISAQGKWAITGYVSLVSLLVGSLMFASAIHALGFQ